jgi:hypothetical protein
VHHRDQLGGVTRPGGARDRGGIRPAARLHRPAARPGRQAGGVVSLRLRDRDGTVAAQGVTSSDVDAPARAPFSGSLAFDPPAGQEDWTLEVFEANRADGSVRYAVELPVKVGG